MADETDIERACRIIDRTIKRQADTIRDLTAALEIAIDTMMHTSHRLADFDRGHAELDVVVEGAKDALARAASEGGENG